MTTLPLRQNPLSLYDFLGYFVPGAALLYFVLHLRSHPADPVNPLHVVAQGGKLGSAEAYIPFVILAYIAGHLLSFLSSVTVERYSIWQVGHPSQYLLGRPAPGYFEVLEPRGLRKVIRLIGWILLLPVSLHDLIVGRWFRF